MDSVLVANRGEIAIRVFKTCRRLGIRTIAVYSDADAHALHVAEADGAIHIGPPRASESYLNQPAILNAAKAARATAVHPGYGFLAENPDFAQAVIDAGLVWIGPPPDAMRALGDKARAKSLAQRNAVPTLPGYHADDQSLKTLVNEAERIGYPILIKASAGGGGRGMRVVESAADFEDALGGAKREALGSFGNDRVLLERYAARPRHIEIQIIGDSHGTLVHLGERECSIQRRHQKLIEESPSPVVDAGLRARMGDAALRLARAAGYTNAGTVEFLVDQRGDFAFLEVNARLQVEHPVTEAVTGFDLVELQLRAAAGKPLGISQADVTFAGHAVETRVIAEDPLAGFLPSTGTLERVRFPGSARVDTWVHEGTTVSPYYDSLLAKVITRADTREDSVRAMATALTDIELDGVSTNVDLLLSVVESPAFLSGNLHTGFLEEHHLVEALAEIPSKVMAAATVVDQLAPPRGDPWQATTAWRVGRMNQPAAWTRAGRSHTATSTVQLDGGVDVYTAKAHHDAGLLGGGHVRVDGETVSVSGSGDARVVRWRNRSYRLRRTPPLSVEATVQERGARGGSGILVAAMPGRVVKISVEAGQAVVQNQPLLVLEAMKMEHVVEAPHAGVVTELVVAVGEQLASGQRLLTIGTPDGIEAIE